MLLAWNDHSADEIHVSHFAGAGDPIWQTTIARPTPRPVTTSLTPRQPPVVVSEDPGPARVRLAGFASHGGGSLLLTVQAQLCEPPTLTRSASLALHGLDLTGQFVFEGIDPLALGGLAGLDAPLAPMAMSTCRLAVGHGHMCMHLGQLRDGLGEQLVQSGLACVLSFSPSTGRPESRTRARVLPWIGSRSVDQRCAADDARRQFVLASLSDNFPRGIVLTVVSNDAQHSQAVVGLAGSHAGALSAELGGLVALRDAYVASFTANLFDEPECRDVYLVFTRPALDATPVVVRLTQHSPGIYAVDPKLARIGRNLLVVWKTISPEVGQLRHFLAICTPQGALLCRPTEVDALQYHRPDDFVSDVNGTVHWCVAIADELHWYQLSYAKYAKQSGVLS